VFAELSYYIATVTPEELFRFLVHAQQWAAALAHPMVAEIGAGTLPHAMFRFYFEQNISYLREYARAIAFAAAGTADRGALSVLARFLVQIADVEIPANEAFLSRLGGSPGSSVPMLPTTYAYTRHLLDATSRGGLAVALAALLPCQWSYGEIGRHLARSLADGLHPGRLRPRLTAQVPGHLTHGREHLVSLGQRVRRVGRRHR
jgi:thiaminase